ncbi:MAG: hypothetical protein ACD_75C01808G0001 [uncultured bacterium]|nr:MAG: hypothetical protein ACD_75C01808G0001 [uncultured bacterium]
MVRISAFRYGSLISAFLGILPQISIPALAINLTHLWLEYYDSGHHSVNKIALHNNRIRMTKPMSERQV